MILKLSVVMFSSHCVWWCSPALLKLFSEIQLTLFPIEIKHLLFLHYISLIGFMCALCGAYLWLDNVKKTLISFTFGGSQIPQRLHSHLLFYIPNDHTWALLPKNFYMSKSIVGIEYLILFMHIIAL